MFSVIQDAIDPNINIIKHTPTGFYNVTKSAKQFYESNQSTSRKEIKNWLQLVQTKSLFEATREVYNLGEVMIQLNTDTRDEHKGTYVHHTLYRAFLMWLNPKYAIKIFAIIDEHQRAFEEKLKADANRVNNKNAELQDTINRMEMKLDAVLEHTEDLKYDLESTKTSLTSKLDTVVGMLTAKSIVSTMNPRNPNMVHHFIVMGHSFTDESNRNGKRLSFIAGQETRIKAAKRQKLEHRWNVEIEKQYNANPIDLRNNIADVVNAYINRRAKELQIAREAIPITCKKLSATYVDNEYISYEELKEVINRVNFDTQRSPYFL